MTRRADGSVGKTEGRGAEADAKLLVLVPGCLLGEGETEQSIVPFRTCSISGA